MPEITPLHMAIGGSAVLGVFGALVILAGVVFGGVMMVKKIRARKGTADTTGVATSLAPKAALPKLLGVAAGALHSPLLQEAEKALASAMHAHQHAFMNAALAKMFPALTPFLGVIDGVVDSGLAKATGDGSVSEVDTIRQAVEGLVKAIVEQKQAKQAAVK